MNGGRDSREGPFASGSSSSSGVFSPGGTRRSTDTNIVEAPTTSAGAAAASMAGIYPHEPERLRQSSSASLRHRSSPQFAEEPDRRRSSSAAQALLSMVTPSYWGFRDSGEGLGVTGEVGRCGSSNLGGAEGPEDGESEAATDRWRSRSRSGAVFESGDEDDDKGGGGGLDVGGGWPAAQVMARSRGRNPCDV